MFVILLTFASEDGRAGQLLEGHKQWLERGLDHGVFLLVGRLHAGSGGAIIAHGTSLAELHERANEDPFVAEGVVTAEILQITPTRADERLAFLLD